MRTCPPAEAGIVHRIRPARRPRLYHPHGLHVPDALSTAGQSHLEVPQIRHSRESGNPVVTIGCFVADVLIFGFLDSCFRRSDG